MIPALVLTAGLATRLRPLSFLRAKAAFPVAGVPLVERIVRQLVTAGVRDVALNLHHRPESIAAVMGDGDHLGACVRYSWEPTLLGSAGGPKRALGLLRDETWFIVNGDTLATVDFSGLLAEHRRSGAWVTLALMPNLEPDKYSGVMLDAVGRFTGVAPKGAAAGSYHFVGVQVAERAAFAPVPADIPCESIGRLYPDLVRTRPDAVRGLVCATAFSDIGTPKDYLDTSLRVAGADEAPALIDSTARIEEGASITRSIVWDDVVVGAGARLDRCIVGTGARVRPGAVWHDVVLRPPAAVLALGEVIENGVAVLPLE